VDGDLNIPDLRAFVASVRAGSISQAATILAVSQPTVSQRLQRLERAIGDRLLVRGKQGVRPTAAGERLLGYAERILAMQQEARHGVAAGPAAAARGRRTIGLLEDLVVTALPVVLADYAVLHPQVQLRVRTGAAAELKRLAVRGQLDLAFGDPTVMPEACIRWRHQAPLAWASSPGLDLTGAELPLVMFSPPCRWRRPVLDAVERAGRRWRVAFQSNSMAAVQAAVVTGLGAAALLPGSVPAGCSADAAATLLPDLPEVDIAVSRRPGVEGDLALNTLESLLVASVGAAYQARPAA
jgi:DNA-binding transcriptional LysR family regulator